MIEKSHFLQIRGTVFCNGGITYTSDNLSKMMTLFPSYVPSLQSIEIPNGLLQGTIEQQPWKMVSPNSEYTIFIMPNKIDIILNNGVLYNEQVIVSFAKFCSDSFIKISNTFDLTITRMALSPKYAVKTSELGGITQYANSVFAKSKFCGNPIESMAFNNVFRLIKAIGNFNSVKINFLANFEEGNLVEQSKNKPDTIVPCLCYTFDINTYPVPDIAFKESEITSFFEEVVTWNKEFAEFYEI